MVYQIYKINNIKCCTFIITTIKVEDIDYVVWCICYFFQKRKKPKKSAKASLFKLVIPVRLVSKVELITWCTPKYYKSEKLKKEKKQNKGTIGWQI